MTDVISPELEAELKADWVKRNHAEDWEKKRKSPDWKRKSLDAAHYMRVRTGEKFGVEHPTWWLCDICNKPISQYPKDGGNCQICLDHNHETGKFRGWLCHSCNSKVGWYEGRREQIERYLKK